MQPCVSFGITDRAGIAARCGKRTSIVEHPGNIFRRNRFRLRSIILRRLVFLLWLLFLLLCFRPLITDCLRFYIRFSRPILYYKVFVVNRTQIQQEFHLANEVVCAEICLKEQLFSVTRGNPLWRNHSAYDGSVSELNASLSVCCKRRAHME